MVCWRVSNLLLLLLAMLALPGCDAGKDAPRGPVILAASSTQEALTEIAGLWAAQGHALPVLSFAGSSSVARQVESGAPADLVLLADDQWIDWLAARDLLAEQSTRKLAGNRLVVIAREDTDGPRSLDSLRRAEPDLRLAMAETRSVPAGRYARAALEHMDLWAPLEPRIVPTENVRGALVLVERGEAAMAIVYASDAQASRDVEIVQEIAPDTHRAITYSAAILSISTHADASAFLGFLASETATGVFVSHGFAAAP